MIQLIIRAAVAEKSILNPRSKRFMPVIAIITTWNESETLNSAYMTAVPDLSFRKVYPFKVIRGLSALNPVCPGD
ncbi:MAG: hypothetical protein ABIK07_08270 [Planctomycetota bacterium]|jgi:hypothetical protein